MNIKIDKDTIEKLNKKFGKENVKNNLSLHIHRLLKLYLYKSRVIDNMLNDYKNYEEETK